MSLFEKLMEVVKLDVKANETDQSYLTRLATYVLNRMPDDEYALLDKGIQEWANACGEEIETADTEEREAVLPVLEGFVLPAKGKGKKAPATAKAAPAKPAPKGKGAKTAKVEEPEPVKTNGSKKAPATAKAAPAKPAPKGKAGSKFDDNAKITILVKGNPHREGSIQSAMFAKYKSGMTIGEARSKIGFKDINFRGQSEKGWIKIS